MAEWVEYLRCNCEDPSLVPCLRSWAFQLGRLIGNSLGLACQPVESRLSEKLSQKVRWAAMEEDTQPWPSAFTCVSTQFEYAQGPMTELHDCGESERYRSESNHPGLC